MGLALGVLVFGGLGTWQLSRLSQANDVARTLEIRLQEEPFDAPQAPSDPDWRRGRVFGTPDWERYMLVGPRYDRDRLGFGLLVPVASGDDHVLVDLGWVPASPSGKATDAADGVVAAQRAIAGDRTFSGLARVLEGGADAAGRWPPEPGGFQRVWARVDPAAMAQGTDLAPYVLVEGEGYAEGAQGQDRDPPIGGWESAPHRRPHGEYAATWFGILACLVGLWAYGSIREDRTSGSSP